jgi:hypothetical protein
MRAWKNVNRDLDLAVTNFCVSNVWLWSWPRMLDPLGFFKGTIERCCVSSLSEIYKYVCVPEAPNFMCYIDGVRRLIVTISTCWY